MDRPQSGPAWLDPGLGPKVLARWSTIKMPVARRLERLDHQDEFLLHPWFIGVEEALPGDADEDFAVGLSRSLDGQIDHSIACGSLMRSSFDVVISGIVTLVGCPSSLHVSKCR